MRQPRPVPAPFRPRRQRGSSLIEILISLAVLGGGLLGLVGLQAKASQVAVSAEDSSRAALLANEVVSLMWTTGSVNLPAAAIEAWAGRVADATGPGLSNGSGTVAVDGNLATVTISWRPPHVSTGIDQRYQTQVLVP